MKSGNIFSKRNRILLYELVKTDFKLRYQGSFLGILWSVLKPLMLFAVMYVAFVQLLKIGDNTPTYPLTLLLGVALWSFFAEATMLGMNSIVNRGDILRKINFPKPIVVMSSMCTALISLSINLMVVILFTLLSGFPITASALLVPFAILQLFVLAFGVSMLLATLYVKFRDIGHIYDVVLQALFYATPIVYAVSYIEKAHVFGISAQKITMLSPITQTIQDIRYGLIAPQTTPTTWSTFHGSLLALVPIVITILVCIIGFVYFQRNSKKFAEMI